MEELSLDELDAIMRAPQPKARKKKKFERTIHTWFYDIDPKKSQGQCDNPDCVDTRKQNLVYVWEHESGMKMCRECFFAGWEPDSDDE